MIFFLKFLHNLRQVYPFRYRNRKPKDWNELVRKSTIVKDPIGSTRNSLTRRDRRSLRRRILEEADHGLTMDTERIVGMYHLITKHIFIEISMIKK